VFVEFDNIAQAITASAALNGRLFAQRRVGTEYMNEFTYSAKDFSAFP
jgi:RNA recognition motif-containing protein